MAYNEAKFYKNAQLLKQAFWGELWSDIKDAWHRITGNKMTNAENRFATVSAMGDAIRNQMHTGKHNLSGRDAAEHAMRMQNDPEYKKMFESVAKMTIKLHAGWTRDQNGNWVKDPNGHYNTQYAQEQNMQNFKAPEVSDVNKYEAWKAVGRPKEWRDKTKAKAMADASTNATKYTITEGFTDVAKSGHNIMSDLGGFGQYMAAHGKAPSWVGSLGQFFNGIIGRNANNFNPQQNQVNYQMSPPGSTTSFWRQ